MLRVILLICSINTPHAQCTKETASSVTYLTETPSNRECLGYGETVGAATALVDPSVYPKIICERKK